MRTRPTRRDHATVCRRLVFAGWLVVSALLATMVPVRAASASTLADVDHWLYLIDHELGPQMVATIAASRYDMVVIDFIPSERGREDYPIADTVRAFHDAAHPKLAIAYIDVGQAEDFRGYWQPGWGVGNPGWIAGTDPAWEGDFPVAYWHRDWQAIWLAPGGLLDQIVAAGFDGVYLDWLEAYEDENVRALAERDDVRPLPAMVDWVERIATHGRAQRAGFIVIGQNAPGLFTNERYLATVDAVAHEHVWFDGGPDSDPQGDCPLPATDADIDSPAYRDSLSPACLRAWRDPGSTLHTSSAEYLAALVPVRARGIPVFTIDYALEPRNVATARDNARHHGFVPFMTARDLDRYIPLPTLRFGSIVGPLP